MCSKVPGNKDAPILASTWFKAFSTFPFNKELGLTKVNRLIYIIIIKKRAETPKKYM